MLGCNICILIRKCILLHPLQQLDHLAHVNPHLAVQIVFVVWLMVVQLVLVK